MAARGSSTFPVTAVLLHRRPYKEDSFLCSLLTVERGRIDCVFRTRSPEFFREFQTKLAVKHGLVSARDYRYTQPPRLTDTRRFILAMYLNELLYWLAPEEINVSVLYGAYLATLIHLEQGEQVTRVLRYFEQTLLKEAGQAIDFSFDNLGLAIESVNRYRFNPGQGFVYDSNGRYSGEQIIAASKITDQVYGAMALARECLAAQIDWAMNGRPVQSRLWQKLKVSQI